MFESLLCFLNEVPSWLNQEHCALLFLSSFSLILPQRVLFIDKSDICGTFFTCQRMFVKHELVVKDHETMHKCSRGGGRWGFNGLLLRGWSIAGVFGIQCVFIFVFLFVCFFLKGGVEGWFTSSARLLRLPSPWFRLT